MATANAKKQDQDEEIEFDKPIRVDEKARRWIPGMKKQITLKDWCRANCKGKWAQSKTDPWQFVFKSAADGEAFNQAWNRRVLATKSPDDKRDQLVFEGEE